MYYVNYYYLTQYSVIVIIYIPTLNIHNIHFQYINLQNTKYASSLLHI